MKLLAILTLVVIQILYPAVSFANCYVIVNGSKNDVHLQFLFQAHLFEQLTGPDRWNLLGLALAPGKRFPDSGQQCFNQTNGFTVEVRVTGGTPSWSGSLVMGRGGKEVGPSGTYVIK